MIDFGSKEERDRYRHSASHIMAHAVKSLFPDAKLGIGPPIEDGFYYDFDVKEAFTPEVLEGIEKRMEEIIKADEPFVREEMTRENAIDYFKHLGEPYKVELLEEMDDQLVTIYREGGFVDLCRGPHLETTGQLKAFKLLSVAGAYWRGSEQNPVMQRIYGTAYPDKKSLKEHLKRLEEAKRRDHRKLGKELGLFSIHDEVGRGLIHWHPKGAIVRWVIEDYWNKLHLARGYEIVYTPHIASEEIYEISGHLENYAELMYSPMDIEGKPFRVKPMNCPGHMMIYKTKLHSYRDLPVRLAEMGTVYRFEKSGVLHGLLRVRGFTIDDAHIICTPEQLEDEVMGAFNFAMEFLKAFGFKEYEIYLATRPEKCIGTKKNWEEATETLRKALESHGLEFEVDEGGGAFYGPKIDVKVKDCLKRAWQCTTIQFDFNVPERFELVYIGQDGKEHRPYMVHRALLGSLERFIGLLIEEYAGAFPLWLAPVQVRAVTITDVHRDHAKKIQEKLREQGVRAEVDDRSEKMEYKIREAQIEKIPYTVVIGNKEVANNSVAVRKYKEGDKGSMSFDSFLRLVLEEIESKKLLVGGDE